MERSELTSQDFLIWWRNRFPNHACIVAPYIRIQIARSLLPESCFTLRVSYLIARIHEEDLNEVRPAGQLYWLDADSRKVMIDNLAVLGMDALVKHLRDNPYNEIPSHVAGAVLDRLNSKIDDYFFNHRETLIDDMEAATGLKTDHLPKKNRLSADASDADKHLTLPYVQRFLKFVENADNELNSLKKLLLTPIDSVNSRDKRRCLDFRIDIDRHLKSFEGRIPEIAEEWLYNTLELMAKHPDYFGK